MVLRGILEKSFGSFLCLRGFCPLGELAKNSKPDMNYQRPAIDGHIDELVEFLNDKQNLFFPEIVLGVSLTQFGVSEKDYNWLYSEALNGDGISKKKLGKIIVSIFAKKFNTDTGRKLVHNTASFYGFDGYNGVKLQRIDGNHRLEAALTSNVDSVVLERQIPFCLVFFRDDKHYKENAATIFRNINFKVRPILEEYNLKIVLQDEETFPNTMLEKNPAYGRHFVWARRLYFYLKDDPTTHLMTVFQNCICTFLVKTLELVKDANFETVFSHAEPSDSELEDFIELIGAIFGDTSIQLNADKLPLAEALAFYKIKEQASASGEYERFCTWFQKNDFSKIENIKAKELVAIFDEVNQKLPKQLFLARWYPEEDKEKRKAAARYSAMERVAQKCNLKLIDMEHASGGTFSIRDMIDKAIPESDLFVADLTGARPNVMLEVGMALHHIKNNRVLFYFQPTDEVSSVPFDLTGFRHEIIVDSEEIVSKVEPHIKTILDSLL